MRIVAIGTNQYQVGAKTIGGRAQANLLALAVALLLVTATVGMAIVLADGAFENTQREAGERATAQSVAASMVAANSPWTVRGNVLEPETVDRKDIEGSFPSDIDVRIEVDGEVLYERGSPGGGTTTSRIVLVGERRTQTTSALDGSTISLPDRTSSAAIRIDSSADVETLRANDRVILHDTAGLEGRYDVELSHYEPVELRFDGDIEAETVEVTYERIHATPAVLTVTVDA